MATTVWQQQALAKLMT